MTRRRGVVVELPGEAENRLAGIFNGLAESVAMECDEAEMLDEEPDALKVAEEVQRLLAARDTFSTRSTGDNASDLS